MENFVSSGFNRCVLYYGVLNIFVLATRRRECLSINIVIFMGGSPAWLYLETLNERRLR